MQKTFSIINFVLFLFIIDSHWCLAQKDNLKDNLKPVSSFYAIKNATIVQRPGKVIKNGTVLFDKGIITAVGTDIAIPPNTQIIYADSMYVYAGFISGLSNIGIKMPKEEKSKDDKRLTGTPTDKRAGITPWVSARELLDPYASNIEKFRKLGFTAAHTVPNKGMMPGKGSIVLLSGKSGEKMLLKSEITLFSQLEGAGGVYPNTVIGVMAKYRDLYKKSQQSKDYLLRYNTNGGNGMERPSHNITLEALYPVVSKTIPVTFKAENIRDIMKVTTLQKELGFRLILGEVKQGWDAVENIKVSDASIFLSLDLPDLEEEKKEEIKEDGDKVKEKKQEDGEKKSEEQIALEKRQKEIQRKYYELASTLKKENIHFGFSTLGIASKDFKPTIRKIIENGLTSDQALEALTVQPANILGVSSIMGSIEKGKIANLIITDMPYFDKKSNVKYVFVDGKKYEYENKRKDIKSDKDKDDKVSGKWNYTVETPQGKGNGIITLENTSNEYTGTITVSFTNSTNKIFDVEINGNKLSFSFNVLIEEETKVDVNLTVEGDTFEGSITVDNLGSFPIEGSKEPN